MADYSTLALQAPRDNEGRRSELPPLPSDVPGAVEDAGLYLNHGILVGELLGVEGSDALAAINEVHGLPEGMPRLFISDDYPTLQLFLGALTDKLASALDGDGRPRPGAHAERLLASPLITRDGAGRLATVSRHVLLGDLREHLLALLAMFSFAKEQGLLVAML